MTYGPRYLKLLREIKQTRDDPKSDTWDHLGFWVLDRRDVAAIRRRAKHWPKRYRRHVSVFRDGTPNKDGDFDLNSNLDMYWLLGIEEKIAPLVLAQWLEKDAA